MARSPIDDGDKRAADNSALVPPSSLPLFRSETLTHQQHKWLGEVLIIRPLSFTFLATFAAAIAAMLLIFLAWGQYTRKARVTGHLVPTQGLIKVYAPQQGIVIERHVQDGQSVRKGDVLFVLYIERNSMQGATQTEVIKQLTTQEQSLREEFEVKNLPLQIVQLIRVGCFAENGSPVIRLERFLNLLRLIAEIQHKALVLIRMRSVQPAQRLHRI